MQVFLSWSGARSKAVADALSAWLSQVIQAVEPWLSSDIEKGSRWSPEIANRLEQSKVGIVCLTRENLDAAWILFEAGAISKTKDAFVCTLLLDIAPADVEQPLGQFQHTKTDKADIFHLLRTINTAVQRCGERTLHDSVLEEVFETNWPRLEQALKGIAAHVSPAKSNYRPEREMLQELLELARSQERRIAALTEGAQTTSHFLPAGSGKSHFAKLFAKGVGEGTLLYVIDKNTINPDRGEKKDTGEDKG